MKRETINKVLSYWYLIALSAIGCSYIIQTVAQDELMQFALACAIMVWVGVALWEITK